MIRFGGETVRRAVRRALLMSTSSLAVTSIFAGVASAQDAGGSEYSLAEVVVTAQMREQNVQVAAGQLGSPPAPNAAQFQLLVDTQGRLVSEEEFENIVIKTGERGQITRLKDVARVELGAQTYEEAGGHLVKVAPPAKKPAT